MGDDKDDPVNKLLDGMRSLVADTKTEPVFKDGYFEGTMVTFAGGLQLFYPYVPLMMVSASHEVDPDTMEPVQFKTRYGTTENPYGKMTEAEYWARAEEDRKRRELWADEAAARDATKH